MRRHVTDGVKIGERQIEYDIEKFGIFLKKS